MGLEGTEPTYAMLYNKTITSKEYMPGTHIPASELDFRYSAVQRTTTPTFNDSVVVTGTWVLLGYLPEGANAVCVYKLVV